MSFSRGSMWMSLAPSSIACSMMRLTSLMTGASFGSIESCSVSPSACRAASTSTSTMFWMLFSMSRVSP